MSNKITCSESHTTIGSLRTAVNAWRRREGWSRESVVQAITETHVRIGADVVSGIRFDGSADTFTRQHTNAERVYRWLDDESKDNNLLPANFLRSIIAALPMDLRLQAVDALLADTGLHADVSPTNGVEASIPKHIRTISKECSEAVASVAELMDDGSPAALAQADRELAEASAAIEAARDSVQRRRDLATQLGSV